MADPKAELVRAWMSKAQSDLGTARKLANGPDAYLDTAIYHCQQAAEKTIKALLVQNDLRFEKTHDLEVLIAHATPVARTLEKLLDQADRLTPYAVAYRYPGEELVPSAEFAAALNRRRRHCRVHRVASGRAGADGEMSSASLTVSSVGLMVRPRVSRRDQMREPRSSRVPETSAAIRLIVRLVSVARPQNPLDEASELARR